MNTKEYWVEKLALQDHPEGGYFKETYRSAMTLDPNGQEFPANRSAATGIYFLLCEDNFSAFHKIHSDEMWHFYTGDAIIVHVLHTDGRYEQIHLGADIEKGEVFQAVVPAEAWFASEMKNKKGYALVGCTVAPGFDFQDFELAKEEALVKNYPAHSALIGRLTRI